MNGALAPPTKVAVAMASRTVAASLAWLPVPALRQCGQACWGGGGAAGPAGDWWRPGAGLPCGAGAAGWHHPAYSSCPPVLAPYVWQDAAAGSAGGGDWETESQLLLRLPASLQVFQQLHALDWHVRQKEGDDAWGVQGRVRAGGSVHIHPAGVQTPLET